MSRNNFLFYYPENISEDVENKKYVLKFVEISTDEFFSSNLLKLIITDEMDLTLIDYACEAMKLVLLEEFSKPDHNCEKVIPFFERIERFETRLITLAYKKYKNTLQIKNVNSFEIESRRIAKTFIKLVK